VYLFKPGDAVRTAAPGARIDYWLKKPAQNLTLEIVDGKGQIVRTIKGAPPREGGGGGRGERGRAEPPVDRPTPTGESDDEEGGGRGRGAPPTTSTAAGLQRFTWDLQAEPVVSFPGIVLWGATTNGPAALPGTYQARLTVDGRAQTQSFTVKKHPWHNVSDADMTAQYELASQIRDKVNEANSAVIQIRRLKQAILDRQSKAQTADVKELGDQFMKELSAVEETVYQVRNQSNQDPLNFPIKTNNRLASLLRVVETGDGRPTGNAAPIFEELKTELRTETDKLQQVISTYLPRFNQVVTRLKLEAVTER
jgi:hypothetical protein